MVLDLKSQIRNLKLFSSDYW